jgi:hypothetical protein
MMERYQLLEQLGEGGAGSVFKAWDTKLQRFVAIKKLLPREQRLAAGAGDNLTAEAAALSSLHHPYIVAVYDLDTDGAEQFVVMEFLNGETLEVTVRRGALLPEDFQQIAEQSLEGLSAAHRQGMCHRDLKPSNIMFHWLPDGKWATRLLDFGLANYGLRPAQQQLTGDGTVAGSVHFMAPEQFLRQPLDVRTDLYSLGCVLYYALTGSFPFSGGTVEEITNAHLARQVTPLRSLRPDVNPLLADWVMWLMSRQPEERPESAAEALRVLRGVLSGEMRNLPVQRVLKTQAVPRRTAVVAAPLTRDASARIRQITAPAAVSQRSAPAPPAAAPKPPAPVARPGTTPAKSGKSAASKTAKRPRAAGKSKAPLLAAAAIFATAAGAVIFFLTRPRGETPVAGGGGGSGGAVELPAGPPEKGLVIWLDASRGARKDAGSKEAVPGDRVDHWDDRAVLSGNNPAQYHKSGSQPEEKAKRRPTLLRVTDKDGLKGTHDILSFDGDHCLVLARDRDKAGDPVARELSGSSLSWIAVFAAKPAAGEMGLLSARVGSLTGAWDTFLRGGKVFAGVRKSGGGENHASLPWDASRGYHILAVVWDGSQDRLRQWLTTPDGRTVHSTAVSGTTDFGDLSDIRVGAMYRDGASGPASYLKGGIASLLFYNRALDDADREAAVNYLCRRYFGVAPVK